MFKIRVESIEGNIWTLSPPLSREVAICNSLYYATRRLFKRVWIVKV